MKQFHTTHPHPGLAWLTTRLATAYCSCSAKSLERAVRRGDLKVIRLGSSRRYRFRREWLDAWLNGDTPDTGAGMSGAEQPTTDASGAGLCGKAQ